MRVADHTGAHVRATAAGRVNLIGDHTDYMGGPVLPMAIDLATTVEGTVGGASLRLRSESEAGAADVGLPVGDPRAVAPPWARYPAAVAAELGATVGLDGVVRSTVPVGAGLSSSAALEVATALALGAEAGPEELALACQRAEHAAVGVPSGIMDQLAICAGRQGAATLIDCGTLAVEHVAVPEGVEVWVVDSGQPRRLESSGYAERRAAAEAAAALVGPLPVADPAAIEALEDPVLRRRARHVRAESGRVHAFAAALAAGDLDAAGALMVDSHRSLRDDYEVSTPVLDRIVAELCARPEVFGARLTGAGFGGYVVALTRPGTVLPHGTVLPDDPGRAAGRGVVAVPGSAPRAWRVRPSAGTAVTWS